MKTATFQSPAFRGPIKQPFTITLPADSPLCRHFQGGCFEQVSLDLNYEPDIPTSVFTDHVLELAGELQKETAAEPEKTGQVSTESSDEAGQESPPAPSNPDAIEHLELNKGAIKALKDNGISTISGLKSKSDEELLSMNGISSGRIGEIHQALAAYEADQDEEEEQGGEESESADEDSKPE